jgi:hypothetical protein
MAWVFALKHKDELAQTFIQLHATLELQTEHCIKVFHTDRGGKYMSNYLANYLADTGIVHQMTCVDSNRVVEHFQHTLFDHTQCMLVEVGMTSGWWVEVAAMVTHVYNPTPNTVLPNHACPMSLWSNTTVSIKHLCMFRSACYAINTSKHRSKLGIRATECKLLGYDLSSKVYRLQVRGSTKVI